MVTVRDVTIREFHKDLMRGEPRPGVPSGADTPAAALRTPTLNKDTRKVSLRFRDRPDTGTQHRGAPGPFKGCWQLPDTVSDLSRDSDCRRGSRSLRVQNNIHEDVKCAIKVKPGACMRKEFLSTTVKIQF